MPVEVAELDEVSARFLVGPADALRLAKAWQTCVGQSLRLTAAC